MCKTVGAQYVKYLNSSQGCTCFLIIFCIHIQFLFKSIKPNNIYRLMSICVNSTHSRTYVHKDPIHASLVISLSFFHSNTKPFAIFFFHENIKLNVRKPTEDVVLKLLQFEQKLIGVCFLPQHCMFLNIVLQNNGHFNQNQNA